MKEYTRAKYVFGQLTIEDLLPAFRKASHFVISRDKVDVTYTCWHIEKTFSFTNSDGETEEETIDNPEITFSALYEEDALTFAIRDVVEVKDGKIFANDVRGNRFELELLRRIDLDRMLMPPIDNTGAAR